MFDTSFRLSTQNLREIKGFLLSGSVIELISLCLVSRSTSLHLLKCMTLLYSRNCHASCLHVATAISLTFILAVSRSTVHVPLNILNNYMSNYLSITKGSASIMIQIFRHQSQFYLLSPRAHFLFGPLVPHRNSNFVATAR